MLSDYSSVDIVTWLGVDDRGLDSWQGQEISLFPATSRPALGYTQRPTQQLFGALSSEIMWQAAHSMPSGVEVKNCRG
jgi:hypothetical protein